MKRTNKSTSSNNINESKEFDSYNSFENEKGSKISLMIQELNARKLKTVSEQNKIDSIINHPFIQDLYQILNDDEQAAQSKIAKKISFGERSEKSERSNLETKNLKKTQAFDRMENIALKRTLDCTAKAATSQAGDQNLVITHYKKSSSKDLKKIGLENSRLKQMDSINSDISSNKLFNDKIKAKIDKSNYFNKSIFNDDSCESSLLTKKRANNTTTPHEIKLENLNCSITTNDNKKSNKVVVTKTEIVENKNKGSVKNLFNLKNLLQRKKQVNNFNDISTSGLGFSQEKKNNNITSTNKSIKNDINVNSKNIKNLNNSYYLNSPRSVKSINSPCKSKAKLNPTNNQVEILEYLSDRYNSDAERNASNESFSKSNKEKARKKALESSSSLKILDQKFFNSPRQKSKSFRDLGKRSFFSDKNICSLESLYLQNDKKNLSNLSNVCEIYNSYDNSYDSSSNEIKIAKKADHERKFQEAVFKLFYNYNNTNQ